MFCLRAVAIAAKKSIATMPKVINILILYIIFGLMLMVVIKVYELELDEVNSHSFSIVKITSDVSYDFITIVFECEEMYAYIIT